MALSAGEKERIIRKLKEHTAVAKYAFDDALKEQSISEEELLFLERNIEIISVLKPVVKANRKGAKASTRKTTEKHRKRVKVLEEENFSLKHRIDELLNQLTNFEISPIYQLGVRLTNALSLSDQDRVFALSEEGLVDKDFHNDKIKEIEKMWNEIIKEMELTEEEYKGMISDFEERIDYIRKICDRSERFIIENHGNNTWNELIG